MTGGARVAVAAAALAAAAAAAWLLAGRGEGPAAGGGVSPPAAAVRLPPFSGPPAPAAPAPTPAPTGPGLRGVVVDGEGAPVPGAEVAATRDGVPAPLRGESGADGTFLLPGIGSDEVALVGARAAGFAPTMIGGVRPGGGEVRLVLRPPLRLTGTVRSPDHEPRPGARVRVLLRFPGVEGPVGGMEVHADEEGRYLFEGLPGVEGSAEAAWKGKRSGPHPFDGRGVVGEVSLDLVVDEGPLLEGRVVDGAGTPLEGIRVSATPPGGESRGGTTGADGTFTIGGLEPAPHSVLVVDERNQFLRARREGVVPPRTGLEFVLEPDPEAPGWFRFRCVDPAGRPVTEVTGEGRDLGGETSSRRDWAARADGWFHSSHRRPGRHSLLLRSPSGVAAAGEFTVRAGETTDLGTLRLSPGARLRLRVVDPEGRPVEEALVLLGDGGLPERGERADPSLHDFPGLPPGGGTVTLRHPSHETRVVPWNAGPGETADLGDVVLQRGTATLGGVVRSATAGPVAGVTVAIRMEGVAGLRGSRRTAVTGADGRFSFTGLAGGGWSTAVLLPPRPDEGDGGGNRVLRSYRAGPAVDLPTGGAEEVEIPW